MKEFLELTEQSQKLQIQFQQVRYLAEFSLSLSTRRSLYPAPPNRCSLFFYSGQLQAGETLRNTSHSSTAADLLQARQQLVQHQQQLEELNSEMKMHQEKSDEQSQLVERLQQQLSEAEKVRSADVVLTYPVKGSFMDVLMFSSLSASSLGDDQRNHSHSK